MIRNLLLILYSIRPSACLGAGLFAAGAFQSIEAYETMLLIFISVFCGSACCFLINDIADRKKDLLNQKNRPIATGKLSTHHARIAASAFGGVYLMLSIYIGAFHLIVSGITMLAFLTYPIVNQHFGLLANIVVAFAVSLSFIYGAGKVTFTDRFLWYIMLAVFFLTIVREVMLDGLDVEGDYKTGKPSIPIRYGRRKTIAVVISGYILSSFALAFLVFNTSSFIMIVILIASIMALWVPLVISLKKENSKWMLFNIRSTHLFFALIIIALFIR